MKKIIPYFWCNRNIEEFVNVLTEIFPNSKTGMKTYYTESSSQVSGMPVGEMMSQQFWLCGQEFGAINGGDYFKFSPAVSMTVFCENENQIDGLWEKLSQGGTVMMPLQEYPFSKRYGWIQDRFGVSWQLNMNGEKQRIVPTLLFVGDQCGKAKQAAEEYAGLFKSKDSLTIGRFSEKGPDENGSMVHAILKAADQELIFMDGEGPHAFQFTGAISLMIDCEDQNEIDYFWNAITKEGKEMPCGWAVDKYGITWQVFATFLEEYLYSKDEKKSEAALQAMYQMKKIKIDEILKAHQSQGTNP